MFYSNCITYCLTYWNDSHQTVLILQMTKLILKTKQKHNFTYLLSMKVKYQNKQWNVKIIKWIWIRYL